MSIKVYEAFRVARGVDPFDLLWELKRRGQTEAKARLARLFRDILEGRAQRSADRMEAEDLAFKAWIDTKGHDLEAHNLFSLYRRWAETDRPEEFKAPHDSVIAVTNQAILEALSRDDAGVAVTNQAILEALSRDDAGVAGVKPGIFDIDRWAHKMYAAQLASYERNQWALDVSVTLRRFRHRYYLVPYCDASTFVKGTLDFMAEHDHLEEFGYWNNTDRPAHVSSSQWAWRSQVWNHLAGHERWPEFVAVDVVSWHGWGDVSPMVDLVREYGGDKAWTKEQP